MPLAQCAYWAAHFFNEKAKLGYEGRKNWQQNPKYNSPEGKPVFWMHVSSLGEFEQGRPVLEAFNYRHPDWHIVLTFFSPSGFEPRKNYNKANAVLYLPLDTKRQAEVFIQKINPSLCVFVKYDFWFHYLTTLKKQGIPTLLIAAKFRKDQAFFKWYGAFFREMLQCFSGISCQDAASSYLLKSINLNQAEVHGDPRVDRVKSIAETAFSDEILAVFAQNVKIVVCGSIHISDAEIIAEYNSKQNKYRWLLVPHEVDAATVQAMQNLFPTANTYSSIGADEAAKTEVLILDQIGMLSKLYRYGHIAYIGGGFGTGIHNTLEPAAYGLPILIGPNHQKFGEAVQMAEMGAAFSIINAKDFKEKIAELSQKGKYDAASAQVQKYVEQNTGAAQRILEWIETFV